MTLQPVDLIGPLVILAVLAALACEEVADRRRDRQVLAHLEERCGCTDRGPDLPCPAAPCHPGVPLRGGQVVLPHAPRPTTQAAPPLPPPRGGAR